MKNTRILTILILSYQLNLNAQNTQAFDFVTWPHSVSSFGAGEMGVASLTNDDALVYNPAKLTLTKSTKFSFYRDPYMIIVPIPLTNYTLYHNIADIGSFALSYEKQDFGELQVTTLESPDGIGEKYSVYQQSFSAGYSRDIDVNFSTGIQLRYSNWVFDKIRAEAFSVSLGILYLTDLYGRRFTFGFSLMNLGPAVKFESSTFVDGSHFEAPPTKLNLGISFTAAENNYFLLPLNLSISKPFDKTDDNYEGQSSFKTLFTDWKDFPNDASLHTGLSFIWKPLYFSDDFAFFQEFYAGNFSGGIKTALQNYYTHGMNFGLEFYGYKFAAGYAGVSHNVHYPTYFQWKFPYETFQFSFEINNDLLFSKNSARQSNPKLDHVILSLGLGETIRLGKAKTWTYQGIQYSAENNINYNFEGAFYFNKNNALVSSISYNRILFDFSYMSRKWLESKFETFSFFSSYRYHILQNFHPLFLQAGLGIIRINPTIETHPKYDYKTALQAAAGLSLDFFDPLIISPVIDYNFLLNFITFPPVSSAPRIQGYNQFNFNLKLGYRIF